MRSRVLMSNTLYHSNVRIRSGRLGNFEQRLLNGKSQKCKFTLAIKQ